MNCKNVNLSQIASEGQNRVKPKIGMALIVLIILQSYLFPLVFGALGFDKVRFWFLESVVSYSIIMFSLIIFGGNRLGVFNDYFSLGSITLSCFLSVTFGDESGAIYKIVLFFFGILFSIYIIANRKTIKLPGARSVFIGILWSVAAVVVTALVYVLFDKTYTKDFSQNLLAVIYNSFLFQFTFVTVVEESSYRGLLFSLMVMNGYKENTAFFIQALLFLGAHYYSDIGNPLMFFVIVPLITLFLTLIIKKYKMLYMSIIMHTFLNIFTMVLVTLINHNL